MRRVIVLGPPGSGKSTLARRLGQKHGLPVFHLDQAFHRPGWQPAPTGEFHAEVERVAALPAWVIDGNYKGVIASRLVRADTLVYLDMPARVTLPRLIGRIARSHGRVRADAAPGCPERFDVEFLLYTLNWNRDQRAATHALVETFAGRAIVLRGRREQMRFDGEQFGPPGSGGQRPWTGRDDPAPAPGVGGARPTVIPRRSFRAPH